jgi:ATP-dependent phosphofructokinase / diphosphate-dependent phosphofructokinase
MVRKLYATFPTEVIAKTRELGIDAIMVIGGDGSMTIAHELFRKTMKLVGVPKTIDNDLSATEVTFGFDTALQTARDAIDKLHTTAESHHRTIVVEVMGPATRAGLPLKLAWLAARTWFSFPKIPFTISRVCSEVAKRQRHGK